MKYYPVQEVSNQLVAAEEEEMYAGMMRKHIETIIGVEDTGTLYEAFGSTNNIIKADVYLLRQAGLSALKADLLRAAASLKAEAGDSQIRCSQDAFHMLSHLGDEPIEHFYLLLLNRKNEVIKKVHISTGGLSGTVVDTKVVFHHALRYQLTNAIVLAHNHPSGNLIPSHADRELTNKIVAGGLLLDIKILDHIIVGGSTYLSFMDEGYL